eukprot:TRINITY_DN17330_c0_g1_i1.p1 TRINITY_DN17330_c0_g1~~TRINITY_DN17330_c0_g1_i1.p1  ORF type:complete len:374 (+),score=43.45 TRINITY_DN17330_c0_g1_i1:51-1124(+)
MMVPDRSQGGAALATRSMMMDSMLGNQQPMPTYVHGLPPTMPYMNEQMTYHPVGGATVPALGAMLGSQGLGTQRLEQENCGEELCLDHEKFGADDQAPSGEYTFFGFDLKPILPVALAASTVLGAICMLLVQAPMLSRLTHVPETVVYAVCGILYAVTLGCMAFCAFADPGQVPKKQQGQPKRAHKTWLYPRPIRRYDHYCKWLHNVIGLWNHREFVTMVIGLTAIGVFGVAVDACLAILMLQKGFLQTEVIILLHLGYSVALVFIAGPICQIHVGLVSRNEVAQEWKKSEHCIVRHTRKGENVPVPELDDDEYNEAFDAGTFVYDKSRNPWDQGYFNNCFVFWCNSRWPKDEPGEW